MKYAIGCGKGKIKDAKDTIEKVEKISKVHDTSIQLFNADCIVGEIHIISAILHAKRAFEQNKNTSDNFMTEVLLYASGERQIRHAIKKIGIQESDDARVCILAYCEEQNPKETKDKDVNDNTKDTNAKDTKDRIEDIIEIVIRTLGLERDDSLILPNEYKLKHLGCSEEELNAVPKNRRYDLALEKVALVDIKK